MAYSFFRNPFKFSKPKEDDIPPHSTSIPKVLSPLEPLKFARIPEPLDPESLVSVPSGDLVTQLCEEHKSKIPAVEAPHKSLPRKEEFISEMKQKYKECKKYIHEVNQKLSEEEQRINQLMKEHNKNIGKFNLLLQGVWNLISLELANACSRSNKIWRIKDKSWAT